MSNTIINLDDTISQINNLTNEQEKKDFEKNFIESKESIKIIDMILEKKSEISEELNIDQLFELLSEYNDYVENDKSISITDFKKIKDIVELLEKKLNESKINIVEIK